jgi:hypothetical protein
LLASAVRTERHGIALDVCNSLRAAGVDDPELFQTQMAMLERYSPEKGLELLQAEALKHPEDRAMQFLSSFLDFLRSVDEQLQFDNRSEEFKQRQPKDLQELLDMLKSTCEVRRSLQLAYLDPNERRTLVALFGIHGAESIILSAEPRSALWTDDLTIGGYAGEQHKIGKEGYVGPACSFGLHRKTYWLWLLFYFD